LNSLRLSVEWSRIEPEPGIFDQAALDKYRTMMGLLRERGLEPMVTLHHFTDPLWLTALGGWENPRVEDYFVRFVTRVVEALGEIVTLWCTINEPTIYAIEGYLEGYFPPGVRSLRRTLNVLRRMLLAHGRAYRTIHRLQNNARVGLAHHYLVVVPANPGSVADRQAANLLDQVVNRSVLEAVTRGRLTPLIGRGQLVTHLIDSCDYIGLNYYSPIAAFDPSSPNGYSRCLDPNAESSDKTPLGEPYGQIEPHGLYVALTGQVRGPIYITEWAAGRGR
jgi:beta-glucosidase